MGRHKKKKNISSKEEPEELVKAPHSFVIKRGKVGKHVSHLMQNFREIMEPFTASNLKVRKKNVLKDFVSISSYLNVSHVALFTRTEVSPYFRLCRMPRGPTITYKIDEYTLSQDIISAQRKPHMNSTLFQTAPLLVLNGFSNDEDIKFKLMTSMWRNMFPSIDIHKVQLSKIKRCVLLNYDKETDQIDLRHYAIKVKPVGLSATVRKLITGKKIPDFGQYKTVEEAMESGQLGAFTESEGEADEHDESRQVTVSQKLNSRGNLMNEKSSIRLIELGPRLKLQLVKIEEGIMNGEVLYHSYIHKSKEEIKVMKNKAQQKSSLKNSRKKQQEENVRKKLLEKEKLRLQQKKVFEAKYGPSIKKAKTDNNEDDDKSKESKKESNKNTNDVDSDNRSDEDDDGEFSDYQLSDDEMVPIDDADAED